MFYNYLKQNSWINSLSNNIKAIKDRIQNFFRADEILKNRR
ncbi:MAG: hypothetical protein ACI9IP_002808 [Arcticibacterium sp.]|jgi:hypothetical protein